MVQDADRLAVLAARGQADMIEIFSSFQGEGPRVGERHLFVRFSHCDLDCAYCDTPKCHVPQPRYRAERHPGAGDWEIRENPASAQDLSGIIHRLLDLARHRAVSFTGGEPLLHWWMIEALAPAIRSRSVRTLLETGGMLPGLFDRVRGHIDVLSLDWKLASATGEAADAGAHVEFLRASEGIETYVKLVFTGRTGPDEVAAAAKLIAAERPDVPVILQPCTPMGRVREAPGPSHAGALLEAASRELTDVRVIPQVHRTLGVP